MSEAEMWEDDDFAPQCIYCGEDYWMNMDCTYLPTCTCEEDQDKEQSDV